MMLTEFLLARIAEDEANSGRYLDLFPDGDMAPLFRRVLAECEAKRRIVELHQSWPVLVETPPTVERVASFEPDRLAFRAAQQIAWLTEREYRERFGAEPPTAPMVAALASVYADHPDYEPAWRP